MPKSRSGFSGLLTSPPAPLPDDDDQPAFPSAHVGAEPEPAPAKPPAEVRTIDSLSTQRTEQLREPRRQAAGEAAAPAAAATSAGEERAATTIRLHQPAAVALNKAWLNERLHVNPTLSNPEFASEIVRLGLAAFERQAKRR